LVAKEIIKSHKFLKQNHKKKRQIDSNRKYSGISQTFKFTNLEQLWLDGLVLTSVIKGVFLKKKATEKLLWAESDAG
jgi:hypothetical protein